MSSGTDTGLQFEGLIRPNSRAIFRVLTHGFSVTIFKNMSSSGDVQRIRGKPLPNGAGTTLTFSMIRLECGVLDTFLPKALVRRMPGYH